ncbi:MAG: glycosyltransferase family 1 protein [Desulfobacteraceae bacterium]|nr:glycosyltransferase family 1 protein [Desulfobacteraceae bacterium]
METAKGLKEQDAEVKFFNHGGHHLDMTREAGIEAINLKPEISVEQDKIILAINQFRAPLGTLLPFTEEELKAMVEADLEALDQFKPDGVYCGLNISSMISVPYSNIPMVTQVPTTLCPEYYKSGLATFPNAMENNFFIRHIVPDFLKRRYFNSVIQKDVMKKTVVTLNKVRKHYGLQPIFNLIDFVKSDLVLLPDLPELSGLPADKLPENYHYTGPIFAMIKNHLPREVHNVYSQKGINIFFSLGSSGTPDVLQKIAKYLKKREDLNTICATTTILDPEELGPTKDNFFATRFLPAHHVNMMANVAITHGGAGTIQNAAWCGTPVIGIGFQSEQQANIDGLVRAGMGIRIKLYDVNEKNLSNALEEIQKPQYKENAKKVQEIVRLTDGVSESVRLMSKLINSKQEF